MDIKSIKTSAYIVVSLGIGLAGSPVWAAGKPSTPPPSCGGNGGSNGPTTPAPVRKVVLQPVGTKIINVPNGNAVDISADMDSLLTSAVANSSNLSPADPMPTFPCNTHLEIRSALTTIQLEIASLGITFGYNPGGTSGPIKDAKGTLKVKVGAISMDFSIWRCTGQGCAAVAAGQSTKPVAGGQLTFDIDFDQVKTGADLIINTPLGDVFRAMMADGILQITQSSHLSELTWTAKVREYDSAQGVLIFDAGAEDRISLNQAFEIYAPIDGTIEGVCDVYKTVAYVHTTVVNTASSSAVIDQVMDARGVRVGDVVMVRKVPAK